jgi:hypothetical protein
MGAPGHNTVPWAAFIRFSSIMPKSPAAIRIPALLGAIPQLGVVADVEFLRKDEVFEFALLSVEVGSLLLVVDFTKCFAEALSETALLIDLAQEKATAIAGKRSSGKIDFDFPTS